MVLAGAYGWGRPGLRGLPPRPLALVALRPLVTYALEWLARSGTRDVVISANVSAAAFASTLGDRHGPLRLLFEADALPRGPAGCIKDAASLLCGDPLVVVEGTLIPTVELGQLVARHEASGAALTVVTTIEPHFGCAQPAGVYVISRRALDFIGGHGFQDLKEIVVPRLHQAGERVRMFPVSETGPRVVDLASYAAANYWVVDRLAAEACVDPAASAVLPWPASSQVDGTARLIGPVLVGEGARIGAGATLVGPTVVGGGCVIEPGALVNRSVLAPSCVVGPDAHVHESVLGEGVQVAASSRLHRRLELPQPGRWHTASRPAGSPRPDIDLQNEVDAREPDPAHPGGRADAGSRTPQREPLEERVLLR